MECNNCRSKNVKVLYKLKGYDVVQCKNCGLKFSYPPEKYNYEKEYFTKEHKEYFSSCKKGYDINNPKIKNFKEGIEKIEKFSKSKRGKILDVGCATGVFLDICKKKGWVCYGVDISKYATDYAKEKFGIKAKAGNLVKVEYKSNFFDVISMWDFIEHLEKPYETLKEAERILKKNGLLFISTINEESLMNIFAEFIYKFSLGLIKKPIALLHPQQHLTHFSEKSLKEMLKKNKFDIIYIKKLEVPINNFEGSFLKKKIIQIFYFWQKIFKKEYMIWVIARKE